MERFVKMGSTLRSREVLNITYPEPKDAKKIVEYLNRIGGESDYLHYGENEFRLSAEAEEKYIELQREKGINLMLMGEIGEEVVAMLTLSKSQGRRTRHISNFGVTVRSDYWRNGIAFKMMEVMFEWIKEHGTYIRKINLEVVSENVGAISLYEKFNFVIEGKKTRESKVGEKFYDFTQMGMEL